MELTNEETATPASKPEIKILAVDDREDNLFSIETIFEPDGYIIRKANSGRAALKILLKEHDFMLILMDVQMPDLDGLETAQLIYERDKLKHIPIIFITANDQSDANMFKGYEMGGVDYIRKPINPDLLRAKVSVFVDLYNKNHQLTIQEQKLKSSNRKLEKEIQERTKSEAQIQKLNEQLHENINQLKNTNEELERFAYVASHDLQEPLRKIIIFGDRLVAKYKESLGEEGRGLLDRITKASDRMQLLIKNLLEFSKTANTNGACHETDLNALVESVLSDLEVQIEEKKATINVNKLPPLYIVPSQFRQVFQNLIINALKFSKEDTAPVISIYAEYIEENQIEEIPAVVSEKGFHKISIEDNGIGFDQEYVDQIFTIFKRLHSVDQYEGTGIGLSICKKIVEQYNGIITAKSTPGVGSTFTIIVPAVGSFHGDSENMSSE